MSWEWPVLSAIANWALHLTKEPFEDNVKPHIKHWFGRFFPKPKPDAESSETSNETDAPTSVPSEEVSPIDLLGWNPPDYRKEYREDIIDRIKWTWIWKDGPEEPRIDLIENLACFCPKCGMRIEPKQDTYYIREDISIGPLLEGQQHYRPFPMPHYCTIFECIKKDFNKTINYHIN